MQQQRQSGSSRYFLLFLFFLAACVKGVGATCGAGFVQVSGVCVTCPIGHYCVGGSTGAELCRAGYSCPFELWSSWVNSNPRYVQQETSVATCITPDSPCEDDIWPLAARSCVVEKCLQIPENECRTASSVLGYSYVQSGTSATTPIGCYVKLGGSPANTYYNNHATGAPSSQRAPICKISTKTRRYDSVTAGWSSAEGAGPCAAGKYSPPGAASCTR